MNWTSKSVAIVGGFSDIGQGIARNLIYNGVQNIALLDKFCQPFRVQSKRKVNVIHEFLDVTDKSNITESIKEVRDKFKNIDIFINCTDSEDSNPEKCININYTGVVNTTLTAIECMGKKSGGRGGVIANVASVVGLTPSNNMALYSGTKHAVIGFTRSLASEDFHTKINGINFIMLCPGITEKTENMEERIKIGSTSFPYVCKTKNIFKTNNCQSAEACGKACVNALSLNKNGSIWILDLEKLIEVEPVMYWKPTPIPRECNACHGAEK